MELAGLDVPVIDLKGPADGPRLTVIAGVHGCEYASMAGVRRWAAGLGPRLLRGRVLAVPVLNLPAFWTRSPFVVPQDGKNLNRCFPGDPAGTLAERLADAVFSRLVAGSDALVDAHAGDLPESLQPFALYDEGPREDRARALAAAYGLPYVVRSPAGPDRAVSGSTSAAAAAAGIPAIIAEAGGRGIISAEAVQAHVRGLDGVLAFLGMLPEQPPGPPPVFLDQFIWLRSAESGWWEPTVQAGDAVAGGQPLGTIGTLDGERDLEVITAPADGVVLFLTCSPAVEADGLLLGLGAG